MRQGMPRMAATTGRLEKRPGADCPGPQREHGPADTNTVISDSWPSELGENTFPLFEATQCVMVCYSSPGEELLLT